LWQLSPPEKGLAALLANPGAAGWAGPYLEVEWLTDPWGNPLQFLVRDDRAEVWSKGPNNQSGTDDDIRMEVGQEEREGVRNFFSLPPREADEEEKGRG
jgi:hypothetical protein